MVGSIDPRCETLRGTHWPVKVAGVFGTRVAENHLGQRSATASTGRTYGCKRSDQTLKNSCGTGAVHIWVPAFVGTTGADVFAPPRSRRLPDLEAVEIVFRLRRVEGLAHHHKALAGRSRRRQPGLGHQLGGVGGEIDLRGDARIIQIALDLTPALHLRHDPDRKRMPRLLVEIDAV